MPKWPVTPSFEVDACTPDVDSTRYLRATLSCTDLATDLVRGSARPLLVLDCQARLLLGCVPHRDVSPFFYDTGRGVRAASLASHGQPAVFDPKGTHDRHLPWLPTLPPAPLLLSTPTL